MSDYDQSKKGLGSTFPEHGIDADRERLEPLIGYDEIKSRFLFGIPLVSQMVDPVTKKAQVMTEDVVKDIVDSAIEQAETECNIDIFPVKRRFKMPFDRNLYNAYGYVVLPYRPITSIDKLSVTPANGLDIYVVPGEWIEMNNSYKGQINIVPMTAAFIQSGFVVSQPTGGAFFLAVLNNRGWVPAYWQFEATSGFIDGQVPRLINEIVGTIAAMDILSQLAATFARSNSHSLSIDGLSQSVSTPGPQIFKARYSELEEKKKRLIGKVKMKYGRKIFASNV